MTFDDDLRSRFKTNSVSIDDLGAGAQAVGAASSRRSLVRRVGGVSALAVVLFAGLLAIANLGDEQASDLRTADPDVSEDAVPVPTTDPQHPDDEPDIVDRSRTRRRHRHRHRRCEWCRPHQR